MKDKHKTNGQVCNKSRQTTQKQKQKKTSHGWRDVFDEIDYSWYEGSPGDNIYVYG